MSVVSGDHNEGVLVLSNILEVLKSSANRSVKFEELAESSVVVGDVHLLVDGGSLGHEHEGSSGRLGASVEDVDGFEGHVLESGYVGGSSRAVPGLVGLHVLREDVSVEPSRHGRRREESEGTVGVGELPKGRVVVNDSVALGGKPVDLGLIVVGGTRKEVGSSSTED